MAKASAELYDEDFYAWTQLQASALRDLEAAPWNGPLDLGHLAAAVQDLGSEQYAAAASHLTRLIEHLLKLAASPSEPPRRQWRLSVRQARSELRRRLSTTLRNRLEADLGVIDADAREAVAPQPPQESEKS